MTKRAAVTTIGSDYTALIAEAAYYRAEQRGFEPGHEMADWLEAEKEIEGTVRRPKTQKKPVTAGTPKKSIKT